jgi:hypothetical protein
MTRMVRSLPPIIDTEDVGFERGGHVLLKHALKGVRVGELVGVRGQRPELLLHLRTWCRSQGHHVVAARDPSVVAWVVRGSADTARWAGSTRAGPPQVTVPDAVAEHAEATWGLAARGARIEAGSPAFAFPLDDRTEIWSEEAPHLYALGAASQWDPATAVDWDAQFELEPQVEAAVVQVMTFLVENENAALLIPARFLGMLHPHFREVMQVLALQIADEARHVEVFTRRALLRGGELGLSTAGGQLSLKTLMDEPDFAVASFLLSVLGEGTFLSLLSFLERSAPDPITRQVTHLALQDESRHVAFGLAHLQEHLEFDQSLHGRLVAAIERRHEALAQTSGLNSEVFDSLVLLASPEISARGIAAGWQAVQQLQADMDQGRRRRLLHLGFSAREAETLSSLHTRNFM